MRNLLDLSGKVALITGASSGIGAATAKVFGELGAQVAVGYHHNEAGARQVCETVMSAGGKAIAIRADVQQADQIEHLVAEACNLGPIDILVNNAGSLIERQNLTEITVERWDEVMNLNLTSALLCSQAVAPSMITRKRGAIINVVSIAGRTGGGPGAGAYAAAKAGMIAMTKAMAKELAPHSIRVNAISPGV